MHKAHAAEWRKPHAPKRGGCFVAQYTSNDGCPSGSWPCFPVAAQLHCWSVVLQLLCDDRINTPRADLRYNQPIRLGRATRCF